MPVPEPHAKKLLVIGWCGDIQDLVTSLNMFAPGKTVVTVLCDCCPEVGAIMGQVSNPKTGGTDLYDCLKRCWLQSAPRKDKKQQMPWLPIQRVTLNTSNPLLTL